MELTQNPGSPETSVPRLGFPCQLNAQREAARNARPPRPGAPKNYHKESMGLTSEESNTVPRKGRAAILHPRRFSADGWSWRNVELTSKGVSRRVLGETMWAHFRQWVPD